MFVLLLKIYIYLRLIYSLETKCIDRVWLNMKLLILISCKLSRQNNYFVQKRFVNKISFKKHIHNLPKDSTI